MPQLQSSCWPVRLICCLLFVVHTHAQNELTVPQQVKLTPDMYTQQISISWLGGSANMFDVMILRTELNETVFYDSLHATLNLTTGRYEWNWTSAEPLECTSLSVRIRSREGTETSEWSAEQILQGNDLPTKVKFQMYPQDRIVHAGDNTTFCCIVAEGSLFGSVHYGNTAMNATRLSRRSYSITVTHQPPSNRTGTNVICKDSEKTKIVGAVVFVAYPPLLSDFHCETRDLTSAVCQWKEARDTRLYGKRRTIYSLNKRKCEAKSVENLRTCSMAHWEGNWTLEAVNHLGQDILLDSAEIRHRVRPVAPENLNAVVNAWNATLLWKWRYDSYDSLPLVCQVEIRSHDNKTKRTFTGVGLTAVQLLKLYPNEEYTFKVRCGAQRNFWKWGNWSQPISIQTNMDVPNQPDVWMHINSDNSGQIIWKPLTSRESHGQITSYEVTLWSPKENLQHTEMLPPDTFMLPINLTRISAFTNDNQVMAAVIAKNAAGDSLPASVIIPLHISDQSQIAESRVVYMDRGFHLVWQDDTNSSCGYVIEWHDALCQQDCHVEWVKVAMGTTNTSIESANFQPGVKYNISLFSCSSELLQYWQGYMQELPPSRAVPHLFINQQDSDVLLTWEAMPQASRRGYILGYNIYLNNDSQLVLLANLSGEGSRKYTVKGLSEGSYKFTVKTYNSAGEDTGATISITVEQLADWLILEILATLGAVALLLSIVTFLCYKKRKWVKMAFYPDIPQPKLSDDWTRTQVRGPLDVRPSPHNVVHVVGKPELDSLKEVLVVIPEEDEEEEDQIGGEPVDTDEPASLRYYNQMIDERPIRPRYPDSLDSSSSSMDSGQTDVTYTGIQTSGSSLVFHTDQQGSSEVEMAASGGAYRPQRQPASDNSIPVPAQSSQDPQAPCSGGYKPQSSWNLDSPREAEERDCLAPCLGSPTSMASTQFLLPDIESEEHDKEKRPLSTSAAGWFTNLLSSAKP
ncbi:LIF receptor subunit alpha a isoform X1 [Hippocampus zosterae]|uniref:LIF receptor subunit alpha a isoform X1 n=1 Tax=Hippocampus zosterae TaxID=109293 RepID=UPI00223CD70E|nr:LIF receptor subunit alpha a isoform X1 [Hippocampus zosterae]